MQITEDLMAPATRIIGEGEDKYTEVYQHLAGVPVDLIDKVGEIVAIRKRDRPRASRREIYVEAVEEFLAAVRRGEEIDVLATAKIGKDLHCWLRDDLAEGLTEACEQLNRRKNVVFATALSRWIDAWRARQK
jgi:hypothetical protein